MDVFVNSSLRGGTADEAIQKSKCAKKLDCFATLAMTEHKFTLVANRQPLETIL